MRSAATRRSSAWSRAKGLDKIEPLLARIAEDDGLPALARETVRGLGREYARLQANWRRSTAKLAAWHRLNALSRRLAEIPSVGPIGAVGCWR